MEKNNLIPKDNLISFLEHHNKKFVNSNQVEFNLRLPGRIIISCSLQTVEKEKYSLALQTEFKRMKTFIDEYRLQSPGDLHHLTIEHLWKRYFKAKAEVCAHIHEYDTHIVFTVGTTGRTYIIGMDCGYVGLVERTLTQPREFEDCLYYRHQSFRPLPKISFEPLDDVSV